MRTTFVLGGAVALASSMLMWRLDQLATPAA
jgi:hypothetical protein